MSRTTLIGISEAARRIGCCEDTLRDYDKKGIVQPARDSAGRRIFSEDDLKAARQYREQARSERRV